MPSRAGLAAFGAAVGVVGVGAAIRLFRWRRQHRGPARVARRRERTVEVHPRGAGLGIVVNLGGGSADEELSRRLREALPEADVRVLPAGGDLAGALEGCAADGASVLGIAGGDGSANTAAGVAHRLGLPLLVVPAGTLNHLARDLGIDDVDTALEVATAGDAVAVDLATIGGHPFLNTASFGSYAALVDAREQLEDRIGKWPAVAVAGWRVLRRERPVAVEVDGTPHNLWMVFIGNGRYEPDGFAPSRRPRLDDGLLDVRCISADHPGARLRLVAGLLSGRLGRSPVYSQWSTERLVVRSADGPLRLACDGETFDGDHEVVVSKDGGQVVLLARVED